MISKELLTEVLREKRVILDYEVSINETEIHYGHKDIDEDGFINIYELAHLCKDWLENNTHWDVMIIGYEVYLMEDIWGEGGAVTHKRFTKEREWYLNLFEACEYILEQKKRNKMKTIQEQIEVMQHFANGGEVERFKETIGEWEHIKDPKFDWLNKNYRIKEQKKTITIEKWLTRNKMYNNYSVLETSKIDVMSDSLIEKVKLLDTYEVEL